MRSLIIILLVALLALPVMAAEETEQPPAPTDPPQIATVESLLATTEARLLEAENRVEDADNAVNYAFNLLGLFEAIGFFVTIAAGAGALFGIPRFISAQNELEKARERFDQEIKTSRERLEKETAQKQAELDQLRAELKQSTGNATLALSFLPLGESQYKSGDYKGALDIYRRALELDSNNPIIHFRMGYVYTQSGRLQEAENHLKTALNVEPDFAPALAVLGYTYRRMAEDMDAGVERDLLNNQAEQLLLQALAISPRLVDDDGESWWGSLGGLYRRRGQIDQAIYAYQQAGEVMPNSSYAFSNLALLYMQQGDRDQMIETYRKVEQLAIGEIQANPDNYWANADLLTARLALGNVEGAEEALLDVFTTAPVDSQYALESQMDTMSRLAKVLEEEQAKTVTQFIERIRIFAEETHQKHQAALKKQTQTRLKAVELTKQTSSGD